MRRSPVTVAATLAFGAAFLLWTLLLPTFVAARRQGGDGELGRTAGVLVAALTALLATIARTQPAYVVIADPETLRRVEEGELQVLYASVCRQAKPGKPADPMSFKTDLDKFERVARRHVLSGEAQRAAAADGSLDHLHGAAPAAPLPAARLGDLHPGQARGLGQQRAGRHGDRGLGGIKRDSVLSHWSGLQRLLHERRDVHRLARADAHVPVGQLFL